MTENENSKPETIAWHSKDENALFGEILFPHTDVERYGKDALDLDELNPLIRRSEAEDYYRKDTKRKILELIEEKIGEWEDYVVELLSKVDYEPEPDGGIKPSEIKDKEIRVAIIDTISRVDDFQDLKQKLKLDGEE